jgi:short-subunit dehydrogenase
MLQWHWIIEINLLGIVNICQQFVPLFTQQGFGNMLNVSSQAALSPIAYMSSYNVYKSTVVSLSETLRIELANGYVNVSLQSLGLFKTNLGSSLRSQLPAMEKQMSKLVDK